jgi:hypothetical protein
MRGCPPDPGAVGPTRPAVVPPWAGIATRGTPGRVDHARAAGVPAPTDAGGRGADAGEPRGTRAPTPVRADGSRRGACPPPHALGEHELDLLPRDERVRVAAHLADCPRCAAERRTLRAFLAAASARAPFGWAGAGAVSRSLSDARIPADLRATDGALDAAGTRRPSGAAGHGPRPSGRTGRRGDPLDGAPPGPGRSRGVPTRSDVVGTDDPAERADTVARANALAWWTVIARASPG